MISWTQTCEKRKKGEGWDKKEAKKDEGEGKKEEDAEKKGDE